MGTVLPAADGSSVLTAVPEGKRIHLFMAGKNQSVVRNVGTVDRRRDTEGGLGFSAGYAGRIAFVVLLTNGGDASNLWKLYLWDDQTKRLRLVAHNGAGPSGRPWQGGWVRPTLSDNYLYWVQAIKPLQGLERSSALMQYDIATGATRTLARGIIDQAVAYHDSILFTSVAVAAVRRDPNYGKETLTALDAETGNRAAVPTGLTMARNRPSDVSTDGKTIVWDSNAGLFAWRPQWGRSVRLMRTGPDGSMAAGNFVTFYNTSNPSLAATTYIFDLRSNSYAALSKDANSGATTNGSIISIGEVKIAGGQTDPSGAIALAESVFDTSGLPSLPQCR